MNDAVRTRERTVSVILNEKGGTLKDREPGAMRRQLDAAFAERGINIRFADAPDGDIGAAARSIIEAARSGEIEAVVAGGGDGTLSAVAGVLAGSGVPLGVLPLGTLNHFAKDLGLPLETEAAVAVIAGGHRRRVDLAEVNGRIFINNSSVGLYSHMVVDRERRQDTGWSKWPAMTLALLRVLRRFPTRRLLLCAEGDTVPYRTPCLFVGNNAYRLQLPALGTRERLDEGTLSVYVARPAGPLGLLRLAAHAALGGLDLARDFETLRVPAAEIRSRASRLLVALDGEVVAMRPPLRYRIRPGALDVFASAPEAAH
jgi:diacylglycerol kinase family enzyme